MDKSTLELPDLVRLISGGNWEAAVGVGLLVGTLDIIFISAVWWPFGLSPLTILQAVASGLLGPSAFAGDAATGFIGALLHFAMTIAMAAFYLQCAPKALRRRPWSGGVMYGAGIWLVMNQIVVPLSAAPIGKPPMPVAVADFVGHILVVGLPIALIAHRRSRRLQPDGPA